MFWVSDTGKQSVDTDFIHAGFPMLLRNAHSFAVRLCKVSEHNTGGLLSGRNIMHQASVFLISGNKEGRGGQKE